LKEEGNMSEDRGHCPECGGSDGLHFSDCMYDGTDGARGYYSRSRRSSGVSGRKFWVLYIISLIIGYAFNELIGAILVIGIIFWVLISK
jgi:hypothetical protein